MCRLPPQTIALIVMGALAMVVALFGAIVTFIDGIIAIWTRWNAKQIECYRENKYENGRGEFCCSMLCQASGKCWSAETKVWKLKYGSENKCLIVCRGLVAKRWLNPCDGYENRIVGSRTAASFTVACESQTQVKTNGEWAKYMDYVPGKSWQWCRCECCHSSSPMAQPATKLLQRHSQIVTLVLEWDHNKDYTHCAKVQLC